MLVRKLAVLAALPAVLTLAACSADEPESEATDTEVVTQPGTETVEVEVPTTDTMIVETTTTVDVDTTVREGEADDPN